MRSKPSTLAMRIAFEGPVGTEALAELEARLARDPESVEIRFAGGRLLEEFGRAQEARGAYEGVLARDPAHFGALLNLGTLFFLQGKPTQARVLYTKAARKHPGEPAAFVNLGTVLGECGELDAAQSSYEAALRLDPQHVTARYGLALLAEERGDAQAAAVHRAAAFAAPIVRRRQYAGPAPGPRVLQLLAADGGNLVTSLFFEGTGAEVTELVVESQPPDAALPAHDVLFTAIGDADRAGAALRRAATLAATSPAPRVNDPAAILHTRRIDVAERLRGIAGLAVPQTALLARDGVSADALAQRGFAYPLLLRAAGHHMGEHFELVADPGELDGARDRLPGDRIYAIAFLDGRDREGRYRKYRVLFIGAQLYPLHLAVGEQWKVHYFSSQMHASAGFRSEERRFLEAMPSVLGANALEALRAAQRELGLAYGGIDFGLDRDGTVLLYEANATMAIYLPGDDARFAYRRPAIEAAVTAVRALFARRAPAEQPA